MELLIVNELNGFYENAAATCIGSPWRSKRWDKIVGEKCIAEKMLVPLPFAPSSAWALSLSLSRNVDHVNNIPTLCPLCSRLRCYRGCISSLQSRRRDVTSRAASLPPLSVFHSITHSAEPRDDESRVHAALYSAESCEVLKGLICCAMAVTHLTISATKNRRSSQCWCR